MSALFFLPSHTPTPDQAAELVPDSKIAWDLRVTAKTLGLHGVKISVTQQRVRIDGRVPSPQARETLLAAARRTVGVKSVDDELEVAP